MTLRHRYATLCVLAAGALTLTGCAVEEPSAAPATEDATTGDAATAGASITVTDPWAKAAAEGMSAAFGEITNDGDDDLTVVSAESDAATMVELHETVDEGGTMTMREVDGGFVVPAGETLTLEPGGNHLMFMDLTDPLEAGEEVTVTLTLSDGSTVDVTAPVKDYSGANESYSGGEETDHGDMDTDDAGHEGH